MRPTQVLDAQTDLVTRFEEPLFREAISSTVVSELWTQESIKHFPHEEKIRILTDVAEHFSEKFRWAAEHAYCYRVSPDMCEVLEQAADGLDESDLWHHSLAPTSAGFVRFEQPILLGEFTSTEGTALNEGVRADYLIWGPGDPESDALLGDRSGDQPRTVLYWMSDTGRTNDPLVQWFDKQGYLDKVRRIQGRWLLSGWDSYMDGRTLGPNRIDLGNQDSPGIRVAMQLGTEILTSEVEGTQRNDARLAHALWLLLQQPIVKLQPEQIERAARRRAARKHLPASVTTIMLRRTEYSGPRPETPGSREYLHQWVVRWHWRWQPYGSVKGKRIHADQRHPLSDMVVIDGQVVRVCEMSGCDYYVKRIIIDAYIKGPEGKPLINPEKVMILER